ncbi:hypothetical protein OQJ18_06765 [Fluoribacter dumoffii]|uniref:Phasin protein n=1 Tax=Fluoribacter dumoffii TaxID=463 RepID=A0A377G835_9GAMM|nr:hypothetical protein [Fluoribacter dumoffii]KTC89856.1 hypothetical protein Ldum_0924 [Fluoribacter dumoffii NY 23]MCW8418207.1 hypothetical protein [Fluoribacter dumoffii]MCW8453951.1 hypothetical protein [Fluoribacter dumoffii]MCW8461978.1 hypothetical protein [Fluoribacter dumoffii]MCW8482190.1 hypothetical protein [Fluoribacter dumoffii]
MSKEKEKNMFNEFNKPINNLLELNKKYFEELAKFSPNDIFNPKELGKKNINFFINNVNYFLEYMKNAFAIMENFSISVPEKLKNKGMDYANEMEKKVESTLPKNRSKSNKSTQGSESTTDAHAQLKYSEKLD